MKIRVLVTLEEIDNGWLDPARRASTCAVAQALVNAKIVRDRHGVDVLNDTVLLQLPEDRDRTVFTVSRAFSEWIGDFDRWTALRNNYRKWRKECARLRRLGRTEFPPMPRVKGKSTGPVTVIIDTEERHVSIEGEPVFKSERVLLPDAQRGKYILSIRDNFESLLQLAPERFNSLCRYLHIVSGGKLASFAGRTGVSTMQETCSETVTKPVLNCTGDTTEIEAASSEKDRRAILLNKMRRKRTGSNRLKTPSLYSTGCQTEAGEKP